MLAHEGRLLIAHDRDDLRHGRPLAFVDALAALHELLPPHAGLVVDLKAGGYEREVVGVLSELELTERTLVSTMLPGSLSALRALAPSLRRGLSVPRASRNYLAHPLTRPAAHLMLAGMRRALPRRAAAAVGSGLAHAIMAHWAVVTPALVAAVSGAGGELYAWTVDDARRARALQALGVTGVISNQADLFWPAAGDALG
ncbi:MAG: glycerophosphodiester phosphodiesterase [Solirubrobacteraceae bacterium]